MEASKEGEAPGEPAPEELPTEIGEEKPKKTMLLAVVVAVIIVVAAIAAAFGLGLLGGKEEEPANVPPTAGARATSGTTIGVGGQVNFTSIASDSDGTIVDYKWYFGDGVVVNGSEANYKSVTHVYNYGGNYLVWHAVTDDAGATATDEAAMIRVFVVYYDPNDFDWNNNTAPYAVLSSDNDVIQNNTLVTFNMTGSFGVGGWAWVNASNHSEGEEWDYGVSYINTMKLDFDDGSAVVDVNTTTMVSTHTYTAPGHYAVMLNLTANNSGHNVSTVVMRTIHVLLPQTTPPGPIKNPDAFIEATIGEPTTLDPASCYESAGGEIIINVYETLVWYDGGSASVLLPFLAKEVPTVANGGISDGGLNYTFNLRPGVKFHDGSNVTADDVVYSIQRALRMRDPVSAYFMLEMALNDYLATSFLGAKVSEYLDGSYNVSWIRDVLVPLGYNHVINDTDVKNVAEAVVLKHNDTAVRFRITHPYPAFLQIMAFWVAGIVKKSFVEAHGGITPGGGNTYMTTHMMGTGPYYLDVWEVGSKIHLVRWDSYWGTKGILKDVYVIKSNDVNTRMLMLQSGDADWIYLPIRYEASFTGKSEYRITKGLPGLVQTMLTFNLNINATKSNSQYGTNVTNDFFQDIHMRRAFSHIFNNSQYIANVARGNAKQPNGPIPDGVAGYNAAVPVQEYNVTMAEAEFKLAANPNQPGSSYWDTGFKIALSFNSGNTARKTACEMFKASLEALNPLMTAVIVELDWPVYSTEVFYNDNSFAAAYVIGWGPDYFDADDFVVPELHSTAGTFPRFTGYNNSALDAMMEEASAELDTVARNRMYNNISWACYNDTPYVWIQQAASFQIVRAWVHGWFYNPMYDPSLYYAPLYKSTT
jgi:peptide/nickel transport system substrate-binding protein